MFSIRGRPASMRLAALLLASLVPLAAAMGVAALVMVSVLPASSPATPERITVLRAGAMRPLTIDGPRLVRPARVSRAAPPPVFVGRDGRRVSPARLRRFLAGRGSPMSRHAETLVLAGIAHGVDPRAVVAVAGVESSFGLIMPCYNAWGWGGGRCRWSSWRQAIWSYTRLIAGAYPSLRRGDFVTAGRNYNPANAAQWAARCDAYFHSI